MGKEIVDGEPFVYGGRVCKIVRGEILYDPQRNAGISRMEALTENLKGEIEKNAIVAKNVLFGKSGDGMRVIMVSKDGLKIMIDGGQPLASLIIEKVCEVFGVQFVYDAVDCYKSDKEDGI